MFALRDVHRSCRAACVIIGRAHFSTSNNVCTNLQILLVLQFMRVYLSYDAHVCGADTAFLVCAGAKSLGWPQQYRQYYYCLRARTCVFLLVRMPRTRPLNSSKTNRKRPEEKLKKKLTMCNDVSVCVRVLLAATRQPLRELHKATQL